MLAGSIAHADSAAELEAKGQALAKDGQFSAAIDAFKAADRIEPRAGHACMIALAYTRRELWPQAEIFLDACHQRANASDPLPDWVALAEQTLKERLASANVAAITIAVSPNVPATIAVSSFAPDEKFAPRTIHLAPGRHVVTVEAAGFAIAEQAIDVADRSPRTITIELQAPHHEPPPRNPPVPTVVEKHHSNLPWIVVGAGGAVALAGLAVDLFAVQPVRDKLNTDSIDVYNQYSSSFDHRRTAAIALYAVGAAAIATGLVLHFTVLKDSEVVVTPTSVAFEVRR